MVMPNYSRHERPTEVRAVEVVGVGVISQAPSEASFLQDSELSDGYDGDEESYRNRYGDVDDGSEEEKDDDDDDDEGGDSKLPEERTVERPCVKKESDPDTNKRSPTSTVRKTYWVHVTRRKASEEEDSDEEGKSQSRRFPDRMYRKRSINDDDDYHPRRYKRRKGVTSPCPSDIDISLTSLVSGEDYDEERFQQARVVPDSSTCSTPPLPTDVSNWVLRDPPIMYSSTYVDVDPHLLMEGSTQPELYWNEPDQSVDPDTEESNRKWLQELSRMLFEIFQQTGQFSDPGTVMSPFGPLDCSKTESNTAAAFTSTDSEPEQQNRLVISDQPMLLHEALDISEKPRLVFESQSPFRVVHTNAAFVRQLEGAIFGATGVSPSVLLNRTIGPLPSGAGGQYGNEVPSTISSSNTSSDLIQHTVTPCISLSPLVRGTIFSLTPDKGMYQYPTHYMVEICTSSNDQRQPTETPKQTDPALTEGAYVVG